MNKFKSAEEIMKSSSSYIAAYPAPSYMAKTVERISYNSKESGKGCLFFCKGRAFKKEFLDEAIENGAYMYVSEKKYDVDIPGIIVSDIRPVLAEAAASFYDHPEKALDFYEVTGTKGKTSTVYFLQAILSLASEKEGKGPVGMLSSQEIFDGKNRIRAELTTPEPFELFKILASLRDLGGEKVVMEVSSQALKMERAGGIRPKYSAFLNISPDHVSEKEHPNFKDYFESKLKIFRGAEKSFVNLNSDSVSLICERAKAVSKEVIRVKTNGLKGRKTNVTAENAGKSDEGEVYPDQRIDYLADHISVSEDGISFDFHYSKDGKKEKANIALKNFGQFNAENALMASAMAMEEGIDIETIKEALSDVKLDGRMETFESEDKSVMTIVDFAHNVISFDAVFNECDLRFPDYKKIAVFGAPGCKGYNRRFDMGRSAGIHMDHIIITTDDSDTEPAIKICRELAEGAEDSGKDLRIIEDREDAIKKAYELAKGYRKSGLKSLVLLLGKGAEDFQTLDGKHIPYPSDSALAIRYTEKINK